MQPLYTASRRNGRRKMLMVETRILSSLSSASPYRRIRLATQMRRRGSLLAQGSATRCQTYCVWRHVAHSPDTSAPCVCLQTARRVWSQNRRRVTRSRELIQVATSAYLTWFKLQVPLSSAFFLLPLMYHWPCCLLLSSLTNPCLLSPPTTAVMGTAGTNSEPSTHIRSLTQM